MLLKGVWFDIIETYNELEKDNKKISFRSHITSELISTQSAFKSWVKANNLDINNGFEWDSEVTNLVLQLESYRAYSKFLQIQSGVV